MWNSLINKFIENKIYIFTTSIAMAIFYSINDEILDKFSALYFKQEYGGFIFVFSLFFWVLSFLIALTYVYVYIKKWILGYFHKKQLIYKNILALSELNVSCKIILWNLVKTKQQKIAPLEISKNGNEYAYLMQIGVVKQEREYFKIKDEVWQLLQKYQKEIFIEAKFSNHINT